jgi:hypothetical protein
MRQVGAWFSMIFSILDLPAALNAIEAMSAAGARHEISTALKALGL